MLLRQLVFLLIIGVSQSFRTYTCKDEKCTKETTDTPSSAVSLLECKLSCLPFGGIWPQPTGQVQLSLELVTVNPNDIGFSSNSDLSEETARVLSEAQKVFLSRIRGDSTITDDTHSILINIAISDKDTTYYVAGVDESYSLAISSAINGDSKQVTVDIKAPTFLGARHGLETLGQIIVYDDLHQRFRIPSTGALTDKPVFPHRGLSLDTARSYYSVESILKTIDGMGQNKLNSFHWHITDTHSFPYVGNAYPIMSQEGAYSAKQVYTQESIKTIVEYARVRGVRVTPELDAPAHVGEGWDALGDDLITCFKWEPWTQYCVEPPCGQFDPTNDRVYDILHTIYQEWSELFKSDIFHMGGDEVNLNCWKSTPRIVDWMTANNISIDDNGFHQIWQRYQDKSFEQLRAAHPNVTAQLWTSTLTDEGYAADSLDTKDYILQIWSAKNDQHIAQLLNQNFRVIFSNYDELYLDCGVSAWIGGPGLNWCAPYKGWQEVYEHNPYKIVTNLGVTLDDATKAKILGSEAALWTEQVDEQEVDSRLWPRAAALAERLWANPSSPWTSAQYRMNNHRQRIVDNGLSAELLQPGWCYQNDGFCGLGV